MSPPPSIDPPSNCTIATCEVSTSFYDYRIDLAANIAFLVLFSLCTLAFVLTWIITRRGHAYAIVMTLGCITDIIGYAARIWSYYDQWSLTPYLMQIICLTIAPAFWSAGIYICLASIVRVFGEENSRLKPLWYTYIFVPCDIIALALQGAGGGISAGSLSTNGSSILQTGVNILLAGLSWQVFTLTVFLVLCGDLALRIRRRCRTQGPSVALTQDPYYATVRQSLPFKLFLGGQTLAAVLILWRCGFRVAELNDGFSGPVTYKQGLFIGFEGVLLGVAVFSLAVAHPEICMKAKTKSMKAEPEWSF